MDESLMESIEAVKALDVCISITHKDGPVPKCYPVRYSQQENAEEVKPDFIVGAINKV